MKLTLTILILYFISTSYGIRQYLTKLFNREKYDKFIDDLKNNR